MSSNQYTPEEIEKLAKIPGFLERLAEEREAWGRVKKAEEATRAAINSPGGVLEDVLERGRTSALPELKHAAQETTAQHLEPMNHFFRGEGRRFIRVLAVPELEQSNPDAYQVALALKQLLDDWQAALQQLRNVAETEAAARATHQQIAAPLEAEVLRVLGRGLH